MRLAVLVGLLAAPALASAVPASVHVSPGGVFAPARVSSGTQTPDGGSAAVNFGALRGGSLRLGIELGEYVHNSFNLEVSRAWGDANSRNIVAGEFGITTLAAGYDLGVEFFGRRGFSFLPRFTPFASVGFLAGAAWLGVDMHATDPAIRAELATQEKTIFYLEFHARAGLRYALENGIGFRAEVIASTYGGFFATMPALAVTYALN